MTRKELFDELNERAGVGSFHQRLQLTSVIQKISQGTLYRTVPNLWVDVVVFFEPLPFLVPILLSKPWQPP